MAVVTGSEGLGGEGGGGLEVLLKKKKKKKKQPQRSVGSRPISSGGLQVHAGRREGGHLSSEAERSVREPRAHGEEEAATALGVFVQPSRSFHQKKEPHLLLREWKA